MDREKVIRDLESWIDDPYARSTEINPSLVHDALALLKEQEDLGTELTNAVELIHKKNERIEKLMKEQGAVEPFHKCSGKNFSLIENSHYDYCPYCGKPITWAKQEGR